jgi:hypothetical protein
VVLDSSTSFASSSNLLSRRRASMADSDPRRTSSIDTDTTPVFSGGGFSLAGSSRRSSMFADADAAFVGASARRASLWQTSDGHALPNNAHVWRHDNDRRSPDPRRTSLFDMSQHPQQQHQQPTSSTLSSPHGGRGESSESGGGDARRSPGVRDSPPRRGSVRPMSSESNPLRHSVLGAGTFDDALFGTRAPPSPSVASSDVSSPAYGGSKRASTDVSAGGSAVEVLPPMAKRREPLQAIYSDFTGAVLPPAAARVSACGVCDDL